MTERKYTVTVPDKQGILVQQVYTDKLSPDGTTIHTYRQDGTLCLKKGFTEKGEYIETKYDWSGKKASYSIIGGSPDPETARLFYPCQRKRKTVSIPFCRRLQRENQKY